jgi:hypothetical protein
MFLCEPAKKKVFWRDGGCFTSNLQRLLQTV